MKEPADSPLPSRAEWISTLRCNLRCRHCAADAGAAGIGELDTEESLAMLAAVSGFGVADLCISGGEPTMRPDWEPLLEAALARFRRVRFLTNGRLRAGLLARAGRMSPGGRLTVVVSIDGLRARHDARRGRGSFADAVATLAAPSPIAREVISTIARDDVSEIDALADLCVAHGVRSWTLQPALARGRLRARDSLGAAGPRLVAAAVDRVQRRLGSVLRTTSSDWVDLRASDRGRRGRRACPAGRDQLVILPDGGIAGCQFLEGLVAGDIRRDDLRAVWSGPVMARVRRLGAGRCPALRRAFGAGAQT